MKKQYGLWKIVGKKIRVNRHYYITCICICGQKRNVRIDSLYTGISTSCGCSKKIIQKHGHWINGKASPTYSSWRAMKNRCNRLEDISYKRYKKRGITYDKSWDNFVSFLNDMGVRPEGTSLDRIDNNGNYCKENCRWATPTEQANNRTNNRVFNIDGELLTVKQIARKTGIKSYSLLSRLSRGIEIEKAVSIPYRKYTFVTRKQNNTLI
jgi:hypothetical protein